MYTLTSLASVIKSTTYKTSCMCCMLFAVHFQLQLNLEIAYQGDIL